MVSVITKPWSFGAEGATREQSENESPEQKEIYDRAYVVFERYNNNIETFNKLYALRYRFMVQFGPDSIKPFDDLRQLINRILISARRLSTLWLEQSRLTRLGGGSDLDERINSLQERIEAHEAIFYEGFDEPDSIVRELNDLIEIIEIQCRAIIEKKTPFQKLLDWISEAWK